MLLSVIRVGALVAVLSWSATAGAQADDAESEDGPPEAQLGLGFTLGGAFGFRDDPEILAVGGYVLAVRQIEDADGWAVGGRLQVATGWIAAEVEFGHGWGGQYFQPWFGVRMSIAVFVGDTSRVAPFAGLVFRGTIVLAPHVGIQVEAFGAGAAELGDDGGVRPVASFSIGPVFSW